MAINPDVLKTALDELMPSYSELFVKWHPLLDKVVSGGNMDKATLKGPRRDFADPVLLLRLRQVPRASLAVALKMRCADR